jgi:formate/nitrite transporter FocA (FNT family)
VGRTYLQLAAAKAEYDPVGAFFRGVLCNALACMAFWMAMAGHTVVDKLAAIVLPISALTAAGFEHAIVNMYYFSMAVLLQGWGAVSLPGLPAPDVAGMLANLAAVTAGNIIGGSVLVALVFWLIYVRGNSLQGMRAAPRAAEATAPVSTSAAQSRSGVQAR